MGWIPLTAQTNLISNGEFSGGMSGWVFQALQGASATGSVNSQVFNADIANGGTEGWHIQLFQGGILMQQDSTYRVRFDASAGGTRTIQATVGMNQDPWSSYSGTEALLDTAMQTFEFIFKMNGTTNSNSRMVFDLGNSNINVQLDNISVEKVARQEYRGMKSTPFTKGVNLTNWFQAGSPYQIDFTKYNKDDFEDIKSLGADVIRLPINLHSMAGPAPDYELDSLFLFFLDKVVNWAEELEMYLILDNHTFDPAVDTDPQVGDILIPVWTNMAEHFKNRSDFVLYEVLNEPHGISEAQWNAIQQQVVEAIRTVDTKHTIVVGAASFNSYNSLQYMPEYADTNLVYTFHFYDPFLLTHQGASWTNPSLVSLSGIPFPYEAAKMPSVPNDLKGTWVESSFPSYANEGTAAYVQSLLDIAIEFAELRGVAIFCGELGVYNINSDNESRVNWHTIVNAYLTERGVSWTNWDYHGGFGIFELGSNGLFDHDLNVPILEAMGFTVPPQTEYEAMPDTTGFKIYEDYSAKGVSGGGTGNPLNFYDKTNPYSGEFAIHWAGANQYQAINFDFLPNKDLSLLAANNYNVRMRVRGTLSNSNFDLRFIDTKTGAEDRPWRMFYRVTSELVPFNGEWQLLEIPLTDFVEMGSWDNEEWFTPVGLFDWTAIDNFNIVSESGPLGEAAFWFDDIELVGPPITISNEVDDRIQNFSLHQNYPNPFNPNTVISYDLAVYSEVRLAVYDVTGRMVANLVNSRQVAGNYSIPFDASGLASGIYFYELQSGGQIQRKSMVLLK